MPTPNVGQLLAHPQIRAAITRALAARGVHGDTELIHADPREEAMLRMMGGAGTVNPATGLRQFFTGGNADPDAGGVGGSVGRGMGDSSGGGTNPGGLGGGVGGALGRALSDIGGFVDRAAGNFGSGWGSRGIGGGYGQAAGPGGSPLAGRDSGAGPGGGHSGQNYISQQFGVNPAGLSGPAVAPLPQAPVISNMPQAPVSLTPMMSSTATTDLAGGERFGALPSWATQPYQVGTEPSAYPTPGVNAGLGAPGFAGNPLPGLGGPGGGVGGSRDLPRPPAAGSGLLGGGQGLAGGPNPFAGAAATGLTPQQLVLAKQLRLSPGALDRLTTPPLGISEVAYQRLTPQQKASWDAARGHPTFTAPPLGISQAAYQKLTPQQKASWAASQGQTAPPPSPSFGAVNVVPKLGPVMGQTAARPAARPAAQPTRPATRPATITAAAKAAAARSRARTGGKNFG